MPRSTASIQSTESGWEYMLAAPKDSMSLAMMMVNMAARNQTLLDWVYPSQAALTARLSAQLGAIHRWLHDCDRLLLSPCGG
jgi:hypothetical protein